MKERKKSKNIFCFSIFLLSLFLGSMHTISNLIIIYFFLCKILSLFPVFCAKFILIALSFRTHLMMFIKSKWSNDRINCSLSFIIIRSLSLLHLILVFTIWFPCFFLELIVCPICRSIYFHFLCFSELRGYSILSLSFCPLVVGGLELIVSYFMDVCWINAMFFFSSVCLSFLWVLLFCPWAHILKKSILIFLRSPQF